MSIAMIQAFKKTKLKPTERLVAFMLADHHNDHTGRCHPSVRLLAEETGLTVRSVITALQKLADAGYITKQETDKTGQNRHYILHPEKGATEPKAVKDVHRCSTFTGEGDSPVVVKDVHRGGEGVSPEPVKEFHLNHNKPELNRNCEPEQSYTQPAARPICDPCTEDEAWTFARNLPVIPSWTQQAVGKWFSTRQATGWMRGGLNQTPITPDTWRADLRASHTWAISTPNGNGKVFQKPKPTMKPFL